MVPNRSHDDGWSEYNFPQLWAPFELFELEICPGAQTVVGGFLRGSLSDPLTWRSDTQEDAASW